MRARFGAESGRENYRNPLESQATVIDIKKHFLEHGIPN